MIVSTNITGSALAPSCPPGTRLVAAIDVEWSKNYRVQGGNVPFCYSVAWLPLPASGTDIGLDTARFWYASVYVENTSERADMVTSADAALACLMGHASLITGHQLCSDLAIPGQAIGCYQHNLSELESRHGAGHEAALTALTARDHLAAAYLAAGRPGEAITCYQRILAARQHLLGADHPGTITTRRQLAAACRAAGKIAAELQHLGQACASYERTAGPGPPQTLACRADLADAYYQAGHLTDAAALLRETLTRCEQFLPPGHHLTRAIRHTMTSIGSG